MFNFQIFTPCTALKTYIECYVHMKSECPDNWQQKLIPSNIQNIGFIFHGHMQSPIFEDGQAFIFRSYILGQLSEPSGATYFDQVEVLAIQFKANGMYRLFGLPMQQFTDKGLDFEPIADDEGKCLIKEILQDLTMSERVELIEQFLIKRIGKYDSPASEIIAQSCTFILVQNGDVPINLLAKKANMSERNFERHFIEEVGISPKIFTGIIRIKSALQMIESTPKLKWTDIASSLKYSDHAHFIHDFKKFSGQTPSEYFARRSNFEHSVYGE